MKVSLFINQNIKKIILKIRRSARLVIKGDDPEALHDTRVAIRRTITILTTLTNVYYKYYVNSIRKGLKKFFTETSELRDEEVILGILTNIQLTEENAVSYNIWLEKHKTKEKQIRNNIVSLIRNENPFDKYLKQLEGLILMPVKKKLDEPVVEFSIKHIQKTKKLTRKIAEMALDCKKKSLLHNLRIHFKKVRYLIEFYSKALPEVVITTGKYSKKMQTSLGDLHDIDVLIGKLLKETELEENAKSELIEVLKIRRNDLYDKSLKSLKDMHKYF